MLIYISCAKTMTAQSKGMIPPATTPHFMREARAHALEMAQLDTDEMSHLLKVNSKIAAENVLRFKHFFSEEGSLPAILSYTGMVFKRLNPKDFTPEDFVYAQNHLLITSFLYGLLRPLDAIKNYRLEGDVRLAQHDEQTLFQFWQTKLTDYFIQRIHEQGEVLLDLASNEMKDLFDWKRVTETVKVITPEFITYKNGKPKTIVVYAKMCRGEMARFVLKNQIEKTELLKEFTWEGFHFNPLKSSETHFVFELCE